MTIAALATGTRVQAVQTALTVDAAVAATTLTVDWADLIPAGGIVEIDGTRYDVTEVDDEADTITLATGLVGALSTGEPVLVVEAGQIATSYDLIIDAGPGDPVLIPIPFEQRDRWPEGDYDQAVRVEVSDDYTQLVAVPDRTPVVDAAYLGGSLPESLLPEIIIPTEPPATSPALSAVGMPDSFILRTEPIAATTRLTYQVSSNAGATWDDLPNMPTRSNIITVKTLPAGTAFALNTPYRFRVLASNDVNVATGGPSAATPDVQLDPSKVALIAQQLITDEVIAGFALLGTIQVGGETFTLDPADGLRIQLANGGLIHLPADGSPATFTGNITAESLDIVNGANINGVSRLGGDIAIGATIGDPDTAPAVAATYESIQVAAEGNFYGLCRDVDGTGWVTVVAASSTSWRLVRFGSNGAVVDTEDLSALTYTQIGGITKVGSFYYLLVQGIADSPAWVVRKYDSTLTYTGDTFAIGDIPATGTVPAIGTDGTNLVLVYKVGSSFLQLERITTAGVLVTGATATSTTQQYGGAYYGSADFGATRWVAHPRSLDAYVFNTGPAEVPGDSWPRPGGTDHCRGLWWDGANFWTISPAGLVRKLESATAAPAATYHLSYVWTDSDTHTTGVSPRIAFARPKRSRIRVTAASAPQEAASGTHVANRIRVYAGADATAAAAKPQGLALGVGVRSLDLITPATSDITPYRTVMAGLAPSINWRLDEASGTSAADSSGNSKTGTIAGGPTFSTAGLISVGTAITFDGVDDRVTVAETTDLTSFSLVAAIKKPTAPAANQMIAGRFGSINAQQMCWIGVNSSGQPIVVVSNGTTVTTLAGPASVCDDTTHLIAATMAADKTMRLYVDGVQVATTTALHAGSFSTVDTAFSVGGRAAINTNAFAGTIDEVGAWWNTVLTAANILALYQGMNPTGSNPTNNWAGVTIPGELAAESGGFAVDGSSNGSVGSAGFRDSVIAEVAANLGGAGALRTAAVDAIDDAMADGSLGGDTGDLTASGVTFSGTARVRRYGDLCVADIQVSRASGFNTAFTGVTMTIPVQYRPLANVLGPGCVVFGGSAYYQYRINSDGTIELRQSAQTAGIMSCQMAWFTSASPD